MNSVPKQKNRRRQIIIEPGIQFRFARFVILFALATAFVTSGIVFFTTFSLFGERLSDVIPQGRLIEIYRTVYLSFFGILLLAIPFILYFSLRFSHRIVGPLPKMYRLLRDVGKGDLEQYLVLRKKDELKELADSINDMIESLRSREQGRK